MKELFTRVMVICTAITSFGGGAYVVTQGVGSISESNIKSVVQNMNAVPTQPVSSPADVVESTDAVVQSIKKLGKILKNQ